MSAEDEGSTGKAVAGGVLRRHRLPAAIVAGVLLVGSVALSPMLLHRTGSAATHPVGDVTTPRFVVPTEQRLPGVAPQLPWPQAGEAALGVAGAGVFASAGSGAPVPIASIAKVMTALVVLRDHPLRPDETGPVITVDRADARRYRSLSLTRQSVLRVSVGESLTERQALDALLVPSANNVAFLLARWDAGSTDAFVAKMNAVAAELHLLGTHYTDPSGYDPSTVSTAVDQVDLALQAMGDQTFAAIVAQTSAVLPLAGRLRNYNRLLGGEVVGVKTGSTRPAGGCVVFAARGPVRAGSHLIVGAVLGQRGPDLLAAALDAARALEQRAVAAVGIVEIPAGTRIGTVSTGSLSKPLVTAVPVDILAWPGATMFVTVDATPGRGGGRRLGTARISVGSVHRSVGVVAGSSS